MSRKERDYSKGGRKGKYGPWLTEEGLIRVKGWAQDGLTEKQIAQNMGISEATINVWKNRFPEFLESLREGKEVIDRQVENALLRRALGFEYEETKSTVEEGGSGQNKRKVEKTKRVIPPDTLAAKWWLMNRKPAEWRDQQHTEVSGAIDVRNQYQKMSDAELKELARKYDNILEEEEDAEE